MRIKLIELFGIALIGGMAFGSISNAQEQTRDRRTTPTAAQTTSADTQKSQTATTSATPTPTKQANANGTQTNSAKQTSDAKSATAAQSNDAKSNDAKNNKPQDIPAELLANRHEDASEEAAAIVPYYNSFLSSYRLGPEDVISITVFGQPNYSKTGITIPPDGRISYYLIPEGVFVAGKTVQQVQDELTKRLDEYIIDPKVTVSLDKAQSTRYAVVGDVVHPGIRLMTRRLSITEAISEAGGILQTGNKKKVVLLRRQPDNSIAATTINVDAIMRGRAPDNVFLVPGDQIIVPGNRIKTLQTIFGMAQILSFARTFAPGY